MTAAYKTAVTVSLTQYKELFFKLIIHESKSGQVILALFDC